MAKIEIIVAGAFLLIGIGFSVSPFHNIWLAAFFWLAGLVLLAYGFRDRLGGLLRKRSPPFPPDGPEQPFWGSDRMGTVLKRLLMVCGLAWFVWVVWLLVSFGKNCRSSIRTFLEYISPVQVPVRSSAHTSAAKVNIRARAFI